MTRVRAARAGAQWRLEVEGHAGYGGQGPDIVCAAVSVLCCALGAALRGEGPVAVERGPGYYRLKAHPATERAWGMIDTAMTGFALLAGQYPGHVTLAYRESR